MELVVLVDEQNREIGLADKATVHTKNTPLHRGFSLFLFNSKNELLLTQRAWNKKTFPGVWTNTLCGHPELGEDIISAARRRLNDELKINPPAGGEKLKIKEVAPYQYRFADKNGVMENEICPILVAHIDSEDDDSFTPNPAEIADFQWIPWNGFLENIKENPSQYSPWSVEEAKILEKVLSIRY